MTFELCSDVIPTRDIPSSGLLVGDVVAVTSVPESSLSALEADEIFSVRRMAV